VLRTIEDWEGKERAAAHDIAVAGQQPPSIGWRHGA
jgi:hypothetical protein